jgi:outer membrane protein assembly factor BamB
MRRRNLSPTTKLVVNLGLAAAVLVTTIVLLTLRPDEPPPPEASRTDRLEQLKSLPYTAVTGYEAGSDRGGVLVSKPDKAYQGYNLFCSRILPEVYLMDMEGKVVHTWSRPGDDIWVWDHAVMQPNGDVIVINKFKELLRLTWGSEVIWRREMDVHHDVAVLPDGTFYAIIRGAELYRGLIVRFPSIVHFTPDGEEMDRWYTHDHLAEIMEAFDRRSFLDTILDSMLAAGAEIEFTETVPGRIEANTLTDGRVLYDYFHLNTVTILPATPLGERDPRFREGNLLICFRNVNQIAVLDGDTKEILWVWGEGMLQWPHHPTMVDNGNILMFDNGVLRGFSRVLEVDPATGAVEWEYAADPPESFYTYEKGSAQRLPNGNTLICDGDNGRAFEVTREGEIVWEWLNPALRQGRRVQLYRIERISSDVVEGILGSDLEN